MNQDEEVKGVLLVVVVSLKRRIQTLAALRVVSGSPLESRAWLGVMLKK